METNYNDYLLNGKLDFDAFMKVLSYFGVDYIYKGGYTNDDYQMYIIDQGDTIRIEDCYDAYEDEKDEEGMSVWNENKVRRLTLPMPKTFKEALEVLPLIFNCEYSEEDIEDIMEDYDSEVHFLPKAFFTFKTDK